MELSIIFLPLIASIISGFFGKYIGDRNSEIVTSFWFQFLHSYQFMFFIK